MAGRGGGPTIGKDLPPGHMTFSGLSEVTGVPVDTLRRWHKSGVLKEAGKVQYGELNVNTFNLDSVVQVKKLRKEVEGKEENSE